MICKTCGKATKVTFHASNIQCNKHIIVQTTHLKCDLEELKMKVNEASIASLNIKDMYPLIRYRLVQKVIQHYSLTFNEEESEVIDAALERYPLL